jgi:methylenetetrahydrofolate dehydrogenase (NADP+)/methenyltetrahydrofolate cyclohydrolase
LSYVRAKEKKAEELGFKSFIYRMPTSTSQQDLLDLVKSCNQNPEIHGILVQSPLPVSLDENELVIKIKPEKDVDGFHPVNVGLCALGSPSALRPCTPAGIVRLLQETNVLTRGKRVVIVGRSRIVGLPLAHLLLQRGEFGDATLTVCHSRTPDLGAETRRAEILISAVGQAHLIKADMVRPGAVVIDVGVNRVEDASKPRGYRLVGDIDYDAVLPVCSYITPVPGGVGPMTIAQLMSNTVQACRNQMGL